jgi:anti-anti-sigma factor
MRDLDVATSWEGTRCTVRLRGEARLENLGALERALEDVIARGALQVPVDCTHLAFMDSASTGVLLRLRGRLDEAGGAIVLFGVRPVVRRLLEGTGLMERLPTAADERAARALLGGEGAA